jgi:membrane protease YdiL (CAAX protease family)
MLMELKPKRKQKRKLLSHPAPFAYLILIASAEFITIYDVRAGITTHMLILFTLLVHSAFSDEKFSNFLLSISFASLIRILSLSMPFSHFSMISWFLIISIPLFIAAFAYISIRGIPLKDIGLTFSQPRYLPIEAAIVLLAFPFAIAEYHALKLSPVLEIGPTSLVTASLIFIICTGFLEELLFRGLMQSNAIMIMGKLGGILWLSALFASMHIGHLSLVDCLLAFSLGFIYSIVREKTGSIYGISVSHGVMNVILFFVVPLYF